MEDAKAPSSVGCLVLNCRKKCSEDIFSCSKFLTHTDGILTGGDPLQSVVALSMLQVTIIVFISRTIHWFLKPIKQPKIISEILGGIAIGPSFLGRFSKGLSERLFPESNNCVKERIAEMAMIYYIFRICLRVDLRLIVGRGRQPLIIGACCLLLPFFTVLLLFHMFKEVLGSLPPKLSLLAISSVMSLSAVPVIFPILKDLHLLNSAVGRISMSASMLNDVIGWASLIFFAAMKQCNLKTLSSSSKFICFSVELVVLVVVTMFVIRPAMHWIVRQTPEGKPVKQRFVVPVLLGVLLMGFFSDLMGMGFLVGPMALGVMVPDGSPLSTTLLERTETILNNFLFPLFFCSFGLRTDLFAADSNESASMAVVLLGCLVAKMVGTIVPSMYYELPFRDSLVLAMIMSLKGLVEVLTYFQFFQYKILDDKLYSILVLWVILTSSILSPLVHQLTRNSRRFKPYVRQTIQHSMHRCSELRILTCVHSEDQVSAIIHLLEASHSNRHHTISLYLIHLVELEGRPSPLLIAHRDDKHHLSSPKSHHAYSPIITAFRNYELRHEPGTVTLHAFTDISPYATMHEDICSTALDHSISLIILPFHKQWTQDGGLDIVDPALQAVNPSILAALPCSVGLLVQSCTTTTGGSDLSVTSHLYRIGFIFIGGPHDREAMSYATCMVGNPKVRLTVVRFVPDDRLFRGMFRERQADEEVVMWFRERTAGNRRVVFYEERVREGEEILARIRNLDKDYNLMMVGRSHGVNSALLDGLLMWSDNPELGVIGDMLASTDFSYGTISVLVIQQQLPFIDVVDGRSQNFIVEPKGLNDCP